MWTAVVPALIALVAKILDILTSEVVQGKIKEAQNAQRENDARKALAKNDTVHIAALMADQHDRVLKVCGSAGRRNNPGKQAAVGPDAAGQ